MCTPTHTCIYQTTCMHVTHTSTCIHTHIHTAVWRDGSADKAFVPIINQTAMVVACNPRIREAETKDPSGKLTS